jgi:nucleoside-diphosphate-sugar epimerase
MKSILVTGATGKQGGAVVNALLADDADMEILAVTRNPQSGAAKKLADKSPKIKIVQGDLDDPAEIFRNAHQVSSSSEPIWGVFSVQVSHLPPKSWRERSTNASRYPWAKAKPSRKKNAKARL